MNYQLCEMLDRERFFEECSLIEQHTYFPEINEFRIDFNNNTGVKFFRSKVVQINLTAVNT